jgi:hypothetical protein
MRGFAFAVRPRAFCIMSRLVIVCSKVKLYKRAAAKASPNRAIQLHAIDAKSSDLPLARVKRT